MGGVRRYVVLFLFVFAPKGGMAMEYLTSKTNPPVH